MVTRRIDETPEFFVGGRSSRDAAAGAHIHSFIRRQLVSSSDCSPGRHCPGGPLLGRQEDSVVVIVTVFESHCANLYRAAEETSTTACMHRPIV